MKYIVNIDNQEYQVEIQDLHARPILALIDGEVFEVMPTGVETALSRPAAATAPRLSSATAASPVVVPPVRQPTAPVLGGATVRAPIPGVILTILVKPGDTVVKGQELFVIEAMKMKNSVRSHRDGVIAEISASPGQTVAHNAAVLTFNED